MPYLAVNGVQLFYEQAGEGAETLVFAHGLLSSHELFAAQITRLRGDYRCVSFDFRGHGKSEAAKSGYDLEHHSCDAAAVIEALGVAPCHFVGFSMGGWVAMHLALRRPELLKSLVLVNTTADAETFINIVRYGALRCGLRLLGSSFAVPFLMSTMFGRRFMHDPAAAAARDDWRRLLRGNNRYAMARAVAGVARRKSLANELARIDMPILVIASSDDAVTRSVHSLRIHRRIRGARLHVIPNIGHTSPVEAGDVVTDKVREFLCDVRGVALPPTKVGSCERAG